MIRDGRPLVRTRARSVFPEQGADRMSEAKPSRGSPVILVDYDPEWPRRFETERDRLAAALGQTIEAIEHIGSTAVPGLPSKPVIDLMMGVKDVRSADALVPRVEALDYEYVPEFESILPERRFFRQGPPERRRFHLHLVPRRSDFWEAHLRFRDFLRRKPEIAERYHRLKVELAARFPDDSQAYSEAKTPFIEDVLRRAAAELL